MKVRNGISIILFIFGTALHAQQTTGVISGTVTATSGAVVPNAAIKITDKATNAARNLTTNAAGLYSAPDLPPGDYEVRVSLQGFKTVVRDAEVAAAATTNANFTMTVGAATEVLTVEAVTPQVSTTGQNVVAGTVTGETTSNIPLNGRSSIQTTSLEPGVTVTASGTGTSNGLFTVAIPGGSLGIVRYMVDGGIINDESDNGGNSMNFSQDIVQATQVNSLSFDPSMGIGAGGAINTVTKSGSNDFHGSGFFFYRDHNMAAYPALKRSTIDPHPFFARKDPGVSAGGPIVKNKLFFFGNYERLSQTQVVNFQEDLPSLQAMNVIQPSPLHYNWITGRIDYHLSDKTAMFLRYTHDNSYNIFGTGNQSGWFPTRNESDQVVFGITRVISPNMVNDFHAYYHYWGNRELLYGSDPLDGAYGIGTGSNYGSAGLSCISALACIGNGDPAIPSMVGSGTWTDVGNYDNGPQMHVQSSYEVRDALSWQKGKHQIRFGIDLEKARTHYEPWDNCFPACIGTYSVEETLALGKAFPAGAFANLPTSIDSTAALNSLPINALPQQEGQAGVTVGSGTVPGFYEPNTGEVDWRIQPYIGDTWKVSDSLTVNYGLEYNLETGLLPYNMPVPTYLNPILEGQTGGMPYGTGTATMRNNLDFSPVFGFAWSPGKSKKTVIRGGAGMYWDTLGGFDHEAAASAIGPAGDGETHLTASYLTNIFPNMYYNSSTGVVPLPIGAPLPLNALSTLTLGDFIQIMNQETPGIQAALIAANGGEVTSGPYNASGVAVAKQGFFVFPEHYPFMRSYQTDIGVQRELPWAMVVSADWVRKQGENVPQASQPLDMNLFGRVSDGLSPRIPVCTTTPDFNPTDECSGGTITMVAPIGRSVYDGLLVKVQKRLSHRVQFLASYALQKQLVENESQDMLNYFSAYGPNLPRQNLNISGTVNLPWGFRFTLNSSIISATPASPTISGIDLNGAGSTNFELSLVEPNLLPYGCVNFSCGKAQLAAAVASFNATYAGTKSFNGVTVPTLKLPSQYQTGAHIINQDIRLTKAFAYKERYRLELTYGIFNVLNIGNLTYGNVTLNSSAFGLPTARVGQTSTFASGGPRAMQIGARLSF